MKGMCLRDLVCVAVRSYKCQLSAIHISGHIYIMERETETLKALLGKQEADVVLKSLKSSEACQLLGVALQNNEWIHTRLMNCELGAEGAKWIGEGLKSNSCLHTLYLNSNNVGVEGAKWIGEGIKSNSSLHTLNIYNNGIGVERSQVDWRRIEEQMVSSYS